MTFHRPPELSPASIDLYLDCADVSALRLFTANAGHLIQFSCKKPPSKFPAGTELAETYWFEGRAAAALIKVEIGELLREGLFFFRKNSDWAEFHVKNAPTLVSTVATTFSIAFILNREARERASFQVRRVETDFEKRMASGDIRAVVNRAYRGARLAGQIRVPHHAHVRELKERAIRESAGHWGRGALFSGDARVEARFAPNYLVDTTTSISSIPADRPALAGGSEPPSGRPSIVLYPEPGFLAERLGLLVRVHDDLRKTVAFVGIEAPTGFIPLGTGFLCEITHREMRFGFLVTANHVVARIKNEQFGIRLNKKGGGTEILSMEKGAYIGHENPHNDIALIFMPIAQIQSFDHLYFPIDKKETLSIREHSGQHGLGDEVVTIGLYTSHFGLARNIPVVRVGHIAALPEEPVKTDLGYVDGYLIETKSIAGLSGSPVFVNQMPFRMKGGEQFEILRGERNHWILGILVGYHVVESKEDQISVPEFGSTEGYRTVSASAPSPNELNTGFAVVIPIERVWDLLYHPIVTQALDESVDKHFQVSGYRQSNG